MTKIYTSFITLTFVLLTTPATSSAQSCGGGESADAMCPKGLCIAGSGLCGSGFLRRCGSDLTFGNPNGGMGGVVSASEFDGMLKHRNDGSCEGNGFYSYEAFVVAAAAFDGFGTTGNLSTRKREVAAFLAQTSYETTGGWATAPDGPYAWGYCYINATQKDQFCVPSPTWPCSSGKLYYGRGPFQIAYNFNYGAAGKAIGVDLLNNPDLVATNPTISFKTALWFWMTSQGDKPSCHDVMTGKWVPSNEDVSAKRLPGYGLTINIINGNNECGKGADARAADRLGFYQRYCDVLNIQYGDNFNCVNQKPFTFRTVRSHGRYLKVLSSSSIHLFSCTSSVFCNVRDLLFDTLFLSLFCPQDSPLPSFFVQFDPKKLSSTPASCSQFFGQKRTLPPAISPLPSCIHRNQRSLSPPSYLPCNVPIYKQIHKSLTSSNSADSSNLSFLKQPTMAARYNLRSISLPSRSHPTTLKIEEQLSKLKPFENSSPSTSKSICNGLLGLDDLYASMDELLQMASTKQVLSRHQNRKWVDELVDGFMKLLDTCGKTRDMILQIQEQAQALQSALRRRKGDSSIRNAIANYTHLRKKTKKEALKLISSTKQMNEKMGSTQLMNQDLHLYAVIRGLKESCFVTICIFTSLLSFIGIQSAKWKQSRWALVSKVLMRKGGIGCEEKEEIGDEMGDVDAALGALGEGIDGEKLERIFQ